ncbi:VOC family protein [Trichocoleus sp. FACHB-262]|uniref:VOC family protein n=1 Tax=Trichocoleus sp. FACHB-262 TaxID=2692869 RepID=UPI0016829712|nr:VOC family protein [Trichocoleus sp. FACHB-262]MBD2121879.1 VOC family protein [Trichocoleus sp. FACHB-262]
MQNNPNITPCLWFDDQAEAAAQFYTSVFRNSTIIHISRYGEAGQEIHGKTAGTVMTVSFELDGQPFTALNGGPAFKFNEAISFQVFCDTQEEVDDYWQKLSAGGDETAQQCGWLKDKYGVSWQIIPRILIELLNHPDAATSQNVTTAMLKMKKIEIDELKRVAASSRSAHP